jgi:transcriptional regulator NrdR family protein
MSRKENTDDLQIQRECGQCAHYLVAHATNGVHSLKVVGSDGCQEPLVRGRVSSDASNHNHAEENMTHQTTVRRDLTAIRAASALVQRERVSRFIDVVEEAPEL